MYMAHIVREEKGKGKWDQSLYDPLRRAPKERMEILNGPTACQHNIGQYTESMVDQFRHQTCRQGRRPQLQLAGLERWRTW